MSNDESQFASVLRMRNCDILQALEKAQLFVRRVRRHPSVPTGLQPLKIALALGAWYFESLTHGLVQLRGADVNQGERLVENGKVEKKKQKSFLKQSNAEEQCSCNYRWNNFFVVIRSSLFSLQLQLSNKTQTVLLTALYFSFF